MELKMKECYDCKTLKDCSEFHKNRTKRDGLAHLCRACRKKPEQSDKIKKYKAAWHRRRGTRIDQRIYMQSTHTTWLSRKLSQSKDAARRKSHELNITLEDLLALWDNQSGLCAITGVPMTHSFHCPFGASVDRIDSNEGYVNGNVQLVNKTINYAKNSLTDEQIREWLDAVKEVEA